MANTFDLTISRTAGTDGSFGEIFSRTMQKKLDKQDVFRAIANWEGQAQLSWGNNYNKPYRSEISAIDYTRGTAITNYDLTNTNESLTVSTAKVVPFYVDDLDALQSSYRLQEEYANDAAAKLGNVLDADFCGEYDTANSANVVDNYAMGGGGSSGDGIGFTLTTSNVLKAISNAARKLDVQNVPVSDRFMVISPQFKQVLVEYLAGKESVLGDSTGTNGHIGKFYGFDLYLSNGVNGSARLEMGDYCTAGDTITINGVTITAAASPTSAGEFDVEASAAAQIDTLVVAINTPQTSVSGDWVALSAANCAKWQDITATDGTTYMTLKGSGTGGYIAVSEVLTAPADVWTTTKQLQHIVAGQKGATHMIVQRQPKTEVKDVYNLLGKNIFVSLLYGIKTFNEGTKKIVDIQLRSDAF